MTKEELENEAKEKFRQKYNCYPRNKSWFTEGYIAGAEPREKQIAELEKENAELKDYRLTTLAKQQTDMSKYALNLEHKLSWYDDQLTKAKEIIKELYEGLDKLYLSGLSDKQIAFIERLQDKAEQFLKGVEK